MEYIDFLQCSESHRTEIKIKGKHRNVIVTTTIHH